MYFVHAQCLVTCRFQGQGATEYLVLLAVVLIISLVSIALLGFFPGTASDAAASESQAYWRSASPLAITEFKVYSTTSPGVSATAMVIENHGAYPIRLSALLAKNQSGSLHRLTTYYDNLVVLHDMSDITISPGDKACFGYTYIPGSFCQGRWIFFRKSGATASSYLSAATEICNQDGSGSVNFNEFGFEYTVTVEGQAITKSQLGKNALAKCAPSS